MGGEILGFFVVEQASMTWETKTWEPGMQKSASSLTQWKDVI